MALNDRRHTRLLRVALLLAAPLLAGVGLGLGWTATFEEPRAGTACRWVRIARAWDDRDHDGWQSGDEPPLAGVRFDVVVVRDELGGGSGTAISDADGIAVLAIAQADCGTPAAAYTITAVPPVGFAPTTPVQRRAPGVGPFWFGFAHSGSGN